MFQVQGVDAGEPVPASTVDSEPCTAFAVGTPGPPAAGQPGVGGNGLLSSPCPAVRGEVQGAPSPVVAAADRQPSPVIAGRPATASEGDGTDASSGAVPQPRERPVSCRLCGREKTWNIRAVCDGCSRQRCYKQGPELDLTCLLPLGHDGTHEWSVG